MEKTGVPALTAFERANGMELVQDKLHDLTPQNDAQRQALAQAQQIVGDLSQTRWLLIEQEQNQLLFPLLLVLVFWLTLLFVSFGLFAPCNATALTVLLVGAGAVSVAIFLVIEPPSSPSAFPNRPSRSPRSPKPLRLQPNCPFSACPGCAQPRCEPLRQATAGAIAITTVSPWRRRVAGGDGAKLPFKLPILRAILQLIMGVIVL
jgi:hypothetical protein